MMKKVSSEMIPKVFRASTAPLPCVKRGVVLSCNGSEGIGSRGVVLSCNGGEGVLSSGLKQTKQRKHQVSTPSLPLQERTTPLEPIFHKFEI